MSTRIHKRKSRGSVHKILKHYIVHFEPMDIEAENEDEVRQIYAFMNNKPVIRKMLISKGFDHDE